MKWPFLSPVAVLMGILLSVPASAEERAVPADFPTVQDAMNVSLPGDVINLAPGMHIGRIEFRPGVTVRGAAPEKTRIEADFAEGAVVRVPLLVTDCVLEKVTVAPEEYDDNEDQPALVRIVGGSLTLRDCVIKNGVNAVSLEEKGSVTVEACKLVNNIGGAIWSDGEGNTLTVRDTKIDRNGTGVMLQGGATAMLERVSITANEWHGVHAICEGSKVTLRDCTITENGGDAIQLSLFAQAEAEGCAFSSNELGGAQAASGAQARFTACRFESNQGDGLSITSPGTSVAASGCTFKQNEEFGVHVTSGVVFSLEDSHCVDNRQVGVGVYNWDTRVDLLRNTFSGNGERPVVVRDGAAAKIVGNAMSGPGDAGIFSRDEGTSVEQSDNTFEGGEVYLSVAGTPMNRQGQVSQDDVRYLMEAEAFDKLEAMATRVRDLRGRSDEGEWELRTFYDSFEYAYWEKEPSNRVEYLKMLDAWIEAYPDSITPRVVKGLTHVNYAWEERSGGWGTDLNQRQRDGFKRELESAAAVFEAADGMAQKDPFLYAQWVTAGMGLNYPRERMDAIVEKGRAIDPGFHPLYSKMAYALTPKWGGSTEEFAAFADQANTWAGPEQGDQMYALIGARLADQMDSTDFSTTPFLDWARLDKGMTELRAAFPDSWDYKNRHAQLACFYRNKEKAAELFDAIGDDLSYDVWQSEETFQQWKRWSKGEGEVPVEEDEQSDEPSAMQGEEFQAYLKFALPIFFGSVLVFTLLITLLIVFLLRRSEKR